MVERTIKEILDAYNLKDIRKWLETTDYFTAPASTNYHGAYKGGLAEHSYRVFKELEHLTLKQPLIWERIKSPVIVGLLHDVCKIGFYLPQEDGSYIYNPEFKAEGHGTLSVQILKEHMELTQEEEACILYHMGTWTNDITEPSYSSMIHKYSNILWTHTADMYASQVLEV
ncbi:MAG: hypothetical protein J6M44_03505 [Butyrivibrio sp.]|nr:hypothetical protein [Butyrivibrio sp.]